MKNIIPPSLRKYLQMSKRERKYEMQSTLWYMPLLYVSSSVVLVVLTLILDLTLDIEQYTPDILHIDEDITRMLVSTLIGGILTLSAFTLNSLLVVLTTFSGQFSPRMLLNFVADKRTQHALGVFNGSFVYVLLVFLFIGSTQLEFFVAVPITTIFLAFLTAMTFIYFINHATTWMQVHNITNTMKENSQKIIRETLSEDLEVFRAASPGDLMKDQQEEFITITAFKNGYIQLADYRAMIQKAREDNIILQFHVRTGDFILKGNRLFSYWGPGAEEVDIKNYTKLIQIGHKELELQDIHMGMNKLAEIAIKSLGNNDPKTAVTTIHQMAELMLAVEDYITFTPYLKDKNEQVRVILVKETFESYLYRGFGLIRYYAKNDFIILTEIIGSMKRLAGSLDQSKHEVLWEFSSNILEQVDPYQSYRLDLRFMLDSLHQLSEVTGYEEEYKKIEASLTH
ncbi:DUF2254 domain-containing protein [Alkalicoccus daliensis]|uniref:Uncharacterized membrane protein n=1 Tax=Alkalicoccus daliensis TaxID=745820 RepID=A0A1H0GYC7_9BACI|nr:DUF2254 domain-containing protein [Alkalicoccus daliensis]SDO12046.1 Uncharacterized membrane protein [Alkalicoccus daliensis]